MRFAVGDIHGCLDELKRTLDNAGFSDSDFLYGVGDLCDRGTQNIETLRFLMGMDNFRTVFGNHDIWPFQHLDERKRPPRDYGWVRDTWYGNGGKLTERQLPKPGRGDDIASWLGRLPLVMDLGDVMIMHVPSPYIIERFREVGALCMKDILGFWCLHDYDRLFWDRRVLNHAEDPRIQSPVPAERFLALTGGRLLVCGHNPVINTPVYDAEFNLVNIDTGAFAVPERGFSYDGKLTLLNLDTLEWIQNDGRKGSVSCTRRNKEH